MCCWLNPFLQQEKVQYGELYVHKSHFQSLGQVTNFHAI